MMSKKPQELSQSDKFKAMAKELDIRDDEKSLDNVLRRIAPKKPKSPK